MSKFAALQTAVDQPFKLVLSSPTSGLPFKVNLPDGATDTGSDIHAYLHVLSSDSSVAKLYDRESMDRRLSRKGGRPTAEELEDEQVLKFARLIAGGKTWKLADPSTGDYLDIPCNESNAIDLLKEVPWVLEQVIDAANNRANFKKA